MIKALIEMETAMIGLQAMHINNEPFAYKYEPETGFYLKTGYEYMSCVDIDQAYFNAIHRKFIKAIIENN